MKKMVTFVTILMIMLSGCAVNNLTAPGEEENRIITGADQISKQTAGSGFIYVYYRPADVNDITYPNYSYIHYNADNQGWTAVPGEKLYRRYLPEGGYADYASATIEANQLDFVFNNGNGTWDNNNGNNYRIDHSGTYFVENGSVVQCGEVDIYYTLKGVASYDYWSVKKFRGASLTLYKEGMSAPYRTAEIGSYYHGGVHTGLYLLPLGNYTLVLDEIEKEGKTYVGEVSFSVTEENPNPDKTLVIKEKKITLYYDLEAQNWTTENSVNIHYKKDNSSWTSVPGEAMTRGDGFGFFRNCTGAEIAAKSLEFVFNNNKGSWDNNNGSNYRIETPGTYIVRKGTVTEYFGSVRVTFQTVGNGMGSFLVGKKVNIYKEGLFIDGYTILYPYQSEFSNALINDLGEGTYTVKIDVTFNGQRYKKEADFTLDYNNREVGVTFNMY